MNNTQLTIQTEEKKLIACAFTGHRNLPEYLDEEIIKKAVENCIKKGVEIFYNGVAKGFDLLSAKVVLSLKKKYPNIKLIACIPCYNQEKNYNEEEKKAYIEVLAKTDEKIYVSESEYFRGCMQKRDRYLVDKADILIAYLKEDTGGTAFTVNYCKKKYPFKEILFL